MCELPLDYVRAGLANDIAAHIDRIAINLSLTRGIPLIGACGGCCVWVRALHCQRGLAAEMPCKEVVTACEAEKIDIGTGGAM